MDKTVVVDDRLFVKSSHLPNHYEGTIVIFVLINSNNIELSSIMIAFESDYVSSVVQRVDYLVFFLLDSTSRSRNRYSACG